jgi:hypothetical protein
MPKASRRRNHPARKRAAPPKSAATTSSQVPPRPSTAKRAVRGPARKQAQPRRRRIVGWSATVGVTAVAAVVIVLVASGSGSAPKQVLPPGVSPGPPDVQPAALVVANPSGIPGVVAYDTTGWPTDSHNGPAAEALRHNHVDGPVTYSVTPPVGGDHNATWMTCGIYNQPVPNERAVHNLEHGAVWITYQPGLPPAQIQQLRAFEARQSRLQGGSRYIDMSPYLGLASPIVVSSWGYQLRLDSPSDARLAQFVDKFRNSPTYSPEYQAPCTGGTGKPLQP